LVAYMNEDERGIANFSDFIRHILQSFVKNKEGDYGTINDAIYGIADLPSSQQEKAFVNYLLEFLDDKALVILIENLNIIFDEKKGMGLEGQQKLRSLMHEHNRFSLMATSQNLFHQIKDSKAPFYQFFNIRHLKKLTFEQAFEFIKVQAELDKATDLLKALETSKMKGKVRAIYELTGGNHRLLVIFYHFLKTDFVADLSKIFEKTMNDLKPYYEQFLNALAPQQQKIVKYLAASHKAKMGKDIAHHCFIEARTLSKQTSELVKKGYIDKHIEGRDAYYELKEPLMRICFEITENLNGVTKLFIDFLSVMYDEEHLGKKYLEFKFLALKDEEKKFLYKNEADIYESTLSKDKLEILDGINIDECKSQKEVEYLTKAVFYRNSENYKEEIIYINKAIELNKSRVSYYVMLGFAYYLIKNFKGAINTLENVLKVDPKSESKYDIQLVLGLSYFLIQNFKKALIPLKKAEKINPDTPSYLIPLGLALRYTEKPSEAVVRFEKARKLAVDFIPYYELSICYLILEKKYKVIEVLEEAVKKQLYIENFYSLGFAYYEVKEYKKAINIIEKANKLFKNTIDFKSNNYNNQENLFINRGNLYLGKSYFELGQFDKATKTISDYIKLKEDCSPFVLKGFNKYLFGVISFIEQYSLKQLQNLQIVLKDDIGHLEQMKIPLLYFDVGIRYLKQNDKRAIYDLSKEERAVFKERVLDVRANLSKEQTVAE